MLTQSRIIIILGLFLVSIAFSLLKGSTTIAFSQLFFADNLQIHQIIWHLRLPRTLTALTCGSLLSLAGAIMQLLLENPLADPYVLGISGGAAVSTLLLMMLGASTLLCTTGAWAGSLLTFAGITFIAKKRHFQPDILLLIGIALACGFSALISFILMLVPDKGLHSMLFFLSGDLNDAQFPFVALSVLIAGFILCMLLSPALNLLLRGDQSAQALGLNNKKYRLLLLFLSSLFTATAVAQAGCIGFVGLIVPHLARSIIGVDHRKLLPICALLGAIVLMIADTFSRTLFAPQQIPVGIMTALIGVPIFIWLLIK